MKFNLKDSNSKYKANQCFSSAYYSKHSKALQIAEGLKVETNIIKRIVIGFYLVLRGLTIDLKRGLK